jgi:hypothetical protein
MQVKVAFGTHQPLPLGTPDRRNTDADFGGCHALAEIVTTITRLHHPDFCSTVSCVFMSESSNALFEEGEGF